MTPDRDPSSRAAREARLEECNEALNLLHAGRGTNEPFLSMALELVEHLQARIVAARAASDEAKQLARLIELIRPLDAASDPPLAYDRLLHQLIARRAQISETKDPLGVEPVEGAAAEGESTGEEPRGGSGDP